MLTVRVPDRRVAMRELIPYTVIDIAMTLVNLTYLGA
jgi:hypothetical protein